MGERQLQIEQHNESTLGKERAALMEAAACTKIIGLLVRRERVGEWDEAYKHISKHFRSYTSNEKPKHTVFNNKYRDREALRLLLLDAARYPSRVRQIKLKIAGQPVGWPGVEIIRWFNKPVGDSPELTCLRILTDEVGRLVTAYPGTVEEMESEIT